MAFAGLWFAGAAGLLSAQALPLLPGLIAEARMLDGLAAWQAGALAFAQVYISPALLALVMGCLLGEPIIAPGCGNGWAAAVRGAVIAAISTLAWLLTGVVLLRFTSALAPAGAIESAPGAQEVFVLIIAALLLAVTVLCGAAAGYLLHALFDGSEPGSSSRVEAGKDAESRMEVGDENAQEW
jgi:hypothetical protein